MFLTRIGPAGHEEESGTVATRGLSLGTIFADHGDAIEACFVNNLPMTNWRDYVPRRSDRVRVHMQSGPQMIPLLIINLVMMAISIGLSFALAPKPAKLSGDSSQSFGISGVQNTTGQGVPIPIWYGTNRVAPHIIGGGIDVSPDHLDMTARVLYCVGDSGGDEYESLTNVEIDNVPVDQYQGVQVHTRLGALTQSVIPEFENVSTPWFDGKTLDWMDDTNTGTPYTYTTHSDQVNRSIVTIAFQNGLYRVNSKGKILDEYVSMDIWYKKNSDPDLQQNWIQVMPSPEYADPVNDPNNYFHFQAQRQCAIYFKIVIEHSAICVAAANQYWADYPDVAADPNYNNGPAAAYRHYSLYGKTEGRVWHGELCTSDKWNIKFHVNGSHSSFPDDEPHAAQATVFNVEEVIFTTETYPGYVLLGLTGIPGKQVKSLQSMKTTVLVQGKKITDPWTGTKVFSRFRPWIVRDMMIGPCGMDYEFEASEIDNNQWQNEGNYYTELVDAQDGGTEWRDYCDFGLNQRRWDWDWVKLVAGEGRAIVVPSGLQYKYLIDKPGDPNLLFCEPGNIIENSIQIDVSPPEEDPYNQIMAEFRDENDYYLPALTQPVDGPDAPYPSIIQKVVHYDTITRESQAMRECMIVIKRQFLERRKWAFTSPLGKIVSEPMDLDWMSERVIGDIGSYTGILPAGSTTTTIVLPQVVTLEAATTYLLIVQKRDNSPAESKTLSTAAGDWVQVTVSSAFTVAPAEGDWFALGKMNVDHIVTRAREINVDSDGRVRQVRSEYVPEIYTADAIPPRNIRRHFPYVSIPPVPLLDAAVHNQVVQRVDGSWASVVMYDVTPGLISHGDTIIALLTVGNCHVLYGDQTGPSGADGCYQWAWIKMIDGAAAGQELQCVFYFAANWRYTAAATFSPAPDVGDHFQVYWKKFADTAGFKIEAGTDGVTYTQIAKPTGTHYERDGGDQGGTFYYRFTPFNASEVENIIGRIVKQVTLAGDTVAPPAPISVLGFATVQFITVEATFALPMALDFAGMEILVRQFLYNPVTHAKVYAVLPVVQTRTDATRENGTSGTVAIRKTIDVRNIYTYPPAPQLWDVAVRAYDYSGNKSAWVQGNDFYPQKLTSNDIA